MLKKFIKKIFPSCIVLRLRNYYWSRRSLRLTNKVYHAVFGKQINWESPKDLNEKIHWLKLYSDTSRWTDLSDKYKVRQYVTDCGLGFLLNELYAKYDSADKIDIVDLPNSFVMKLNNGSGDVLIVREKSKITNREIRKYFRNKQKIPYGNLTAEPHYTKIKPCIIVEKLLENTSGFSSSIVDYKFLCFNGSVKYVLVCANRQAQHCDLFSYDLEWNFRNDCIPSLTDLIPRPKSLAAMIEASQILSSGFPFVRIDFYEVCGETIFGEMTFTPGAGFINYYTPAFLDELGGYIKLP